MYIEFRNEILKKGGKREENNTYTYCFVLNRYFKTHFLPNIDTIFRDTLIFS